MTTIKNSSSVTKATKGNTTYYLSNRDEQRGIDIQLDMQGYTVIAL
ncbi:hypothetical protein [Liquorilactobacillus mali]|nr:hypothetical protein [Liquorilactobacillus mali]